MISTVVHVLNVIPMAFFKWSVHHSGRRDVRRSVAHHRRSHHARRLHSVDPLRSPRLRHPCQGS